MCEMESLVGRRLFLREADVLQLIPVSRSTLWRWVQQNRFPRPMKLGNGITAWKSEEIHAWIDSRERVSTSVMP